MPVLLFLAASPLLPRRTSATNSTNRPSRPRPRPLTRASATPSSNEPGDPSWMDLAREIGPGSESVERPAANPGPADKWQYPAGRLDQFEDGENPWTTWNALQELPEEPVAARDPKAETDFWRDAARSITDEPSQKVPEQQSTDDAAVNMDNQSDVWKMARDVTGEMADLQNRLKQELEQYDSVEKTDQYRDIARELVGPPPEPDDEIHPIRESANLDKGAEAGGGWNPDVDWMRFDDVRRELQKQQEKENRMKAEDQARQAMEQQQPTADPTQPPQQRDSATYTDQSNSEQFLTRENTPRFLRNKFMRSGTYGASWAGAEKEINQLQEQGIPLRDPKADAEQWRSIARDLNLDVESDIAGAGQQHQQSDTSANDGPEQSVRDAKQDPPQAEGVEIDDGVTETSAWDGWRSSSATWERANEKVQPRDPNKEVDMWRASAQELTSSVAPNASTGDNVHNQATSGSAGVPTNVWDTWRSANERWESSLTEDTENGEADSWSISSDSKWSEGPGRKASSERSAWEQWDRVSGTVDNSDAQQWWDSRSDQPQRTGAASANSMGSSIDQWRSVAQEIFPSSEQSQSIREESTDTTGSTKTRLENDATVNPWKSIAKDLMNQLPSDEEG